MWLISEVDVGGDFIAFITFYDESYKNFSEAEPRLGFQQNVTKPEIKSMKTTRLTKHHPGPHTQRNSGASYYHLRPIIQVI